MSKLQSGITITFRIIAPHIENQKMLKNVKLVVSGGRVQIAVSVLRSFERRRVVEGPRGGRLAGDTLGGSGGSEIPPNSCWGVVLGLGKPVVG